MSTDRWGQLIDGAPDSLEAWDTAWGHFVHFVGDPIADLDEVNAADDRFVMGSVFTATYLVLGGTSLTSPLVLEALQRSRERSAGASTREQAHMRALELLCAGQFTAAGDRWAELGSSGPDFAAIRFAHDVYLHTGQAASSLSTTNAAITAWGSGPGASYVAGQHAFALEELGHYDEAEQVGHGALSADPDDLWARHALADVYESTNNSAAAYGLLDTEAHPWPAQEGLATHVWWHVALRRLADGDVDAVLAIADERMPSATTPFRLCDQASLLWRTELAGYSVGDRWDEVANRWAALETRHTAAFLDTHAALTFARRPNHPGAELWAQDTADGRSGHAGSENAETMASVARPLAKAFGRFGAGEPQAFLDAVEALGDQCARMGGSVAQRDIIKLTARSAASQL